MLKLEVLDGQMRVPCEWCFFFFREKIHAPPLCSHHGFIMGHVFTTWRTVPVGSWHSHSLARSFPHSLGNFARLGEFLSSNNLGSPATYNGNSDSYCHYKNPMLWVVSPRWCHEACHGSNIASASTANTRWGRVKPWQTFAGLLSPMRGC